MTQQIFKNFKITASIKEQMKKMRSKGYSYERISRFFDCSLTAVRYNLDKKTKQQLLKFNSKNTALMTPKRKEKYYAYQRQYRKNRYATDPEWREKQINASIKWRKNKDNEH